ncbi:MAG: hypothetical protein HUJ54_14665 [Erysipelotrichaceae bacterium]|nr:hypothetical protein [Erysipelotrichaceae bacterium]
MIHTVWNAILSFLTTILQTVATNITTTWNQIQNALSAAMNAIRSVVVSIWNGISGSISGIVRGISSTVSGVVNGLSAAVSGSFAALRGSVAGIWNGIRNAILGPINNAVGACRSAAAAISGAFSSIHISVPYIPLPHLSVSGSFSINPPSVPHFGISWYREGGILTGPTIFGMGQTSLLAGGEAGKEAVLPLDGFYKQLESMFARNTNTSKMENLLSIIAANSSKGIYLDNGVLVGYLLPEIDSGLGELQLLKARLKV